jgi:hypothetical protein
VSWSPLYEGHETEPVRPAALAGRVVPAGDDPLGLYAEDWSCMVCGALRLYDDIHVAHRPVRGFEEWFNPPEGVPRAVTNVRYCQDRATCAAAAHGGTAWPDAVPVLQAGQTVRVSAAGIRDRIWDARDERVDSDLARALLAHVRDEPATMQDLAAAHDHPVDVVFDTARRLIQVGAMQVIP